MTDNLETRELVRLIQRVFHPGADDRSLAFLVDLPDDNVVDHPAWAARRAMVVEWYRGLREAGRESLLERIDLVFYRNAQRNNADLPEECWVYDDGALPEHADRLRGRGRPMEQVLAEHRILMAVTEMSATAPLKLLARRHGFRAATMPGFSAAMVPALKLDYEEIHRRCVDLKSLLDRATAAHIRFSAQGREQTLTLDLRHREATASGGLVRQPGVAGNLPSGETYIVPYEGEIADDPSRSRGTLPLELDGELLYYRIEGNRIVEVIGEGPVAEAERNEVAAEPAYANVAELGLGLLADYGVRPIGELLLDEKLGLHIAFGRSDHFGGRIGAGDFSSPEKVVHIDRVYLPEVQPLVRVVSVDLETDAPTGSSVTPLMRDGRYV